MASGQGFAPHNLLTDDTVQKFLDEIYKKKRSGVTFRESYYERRDFIPGRVISDFFDCDREDQLLEVDNLVTIATKQASKRPNTHSIARKCPKVFTILITIGRSEFIDFFLKKEGLLDKRLPFTLADERLFPKLMDNTTFFEEFYEKQWEFCAEPLSNNLEPVEFNGNRILPIIHLERVDKHQGSSAWVHKIEVHEDYDELEELAGSQQRPYSNPHIYVIKSYYPEGAEDYYSAEIDGFKKLNESGVSVPNLIGFYGAFRQNKSRHLILQYANIGTLDDYFEKAKSPKLGKDIILAWGSLFKVNDALLHIHNCPHPNGKDVPRFFQGFHGDIKPSNIFVAGDVVNNPYQVHFMLGDLGLSHFATMVEDNPSATGEDRGGSQAYSAPERNLARTPFTKFKLPVKQTTDTWSLGCVYSEFHSWVVDGMEGHHGVLQYREQRLSQGDHFSSFGACFHDSRGELLPKVEEWHNESLDRCARHDHVTPIIWKELLRHMFASSNHRLRAEQVRVFSEYVLNQAREKLPPSQKHDVTTASTSRPRTPPQVPPEIQPNYGQTDRFGGYPLTPPSDNQNKRMTREEVDHTQLTGQSPESLSADSSPSTRYENRESLTSIAENLDPLTLSGASSRVPSMTYAAEPVSVHRGHTISEIPWRLSRASTMSPGAPQHRSQPSNASEQARPFVLPASARFPDEGVFDGKGKGKGKAVEETPLQNTQARKPPPFMSVSKLKTWAIETRTARQESLFFAEDVKLPDEAELIGELRQRDHMFVIDDGESMQACWKELVDLYQDLIYMVKRKKLDPDGSELQFIRSSDRKVSKKTSDLVKMVKDRKGKLQGESDFASRLDRILEDYCQRRRKHPNTRPISLYVFTDGRWQLGDKQLERVVRVIKRTVEFLEKEGANDKMVGIQFISFGNDVVGKERLRWLDEDLKEKYHLARDICDTTPSDGNVWKMLLGSINDEWDGDETGLS